MIHLFKRIAFVPIFMLITLFSAPLCAQALEPVNQQRDVSLSIGCEYEGTAIEGLEFELYHVANHTGLDQYSLTGEFEDYPVSLESLDAVDWRDLTNTLTFYVQAHSPAAVDSAVSDSNGVAVFPSAGKLLRPGLYLVTSTPVQKGNYIYSAKPFIAVLPLADQDSDSWQYHPHVMAKCSASDKSNIIPGETIDQSVLKVWKNDTKHIRPDEVTVHLFMNSVKYDTVTLSDENNWSETWAELPKYDRQGNEINWAVVEEPVKDYTLAISKEFGNYVVTNSYDPQPTSKPTCSKTVIKDWSDKGYEYKRPASVTVELRANGNLYFSKQLTAAMGWTYTWNDLPVYDRQGKEIIWTITEKAISGYTADVTVKGDYFILINYVVKPTLPQTGMLWWPVPVLAAAGMMFIFIGALMRRRRDDA